MNITNVVNGVKASKTPNLKSARQEPLLEIRDLSVAFSGAKGWRPALEGLNLTIKEGQTVALVGESGSGKSITGLSILKLLPYPAARHGDGASILFRPQQSQSLELIDMHESLMRQVRGNEISMIFQEPMMSLNPLHRIEKQISQSLILHQGLTQTAARARTLKLLDMVGIAKAKSRLTAFPHELSGGQKQRVMIAMALANKPKLLIADEPTTALDVTIEAQILRLLEDLKKELGMALLMITHDLSLVDAFADHTYVLEKGLLVEHGQTQALFSNPQEAYTQKLLAAKPSGKPKALDPEAKTLISAQDMRVHFPIKVGVLRRTVDHVRAVDGVSFDLKAGETLGLVGESGSGKSTLGFALLRLLSFQGKVVYAGQDLSALSRAAQKSLRRDMQIVFQDPFGALSPRMDVGSIIGEGLEVHEPNLDLDQREQRILEVMQAVDLDPQARFRYPHEFSGGQRQRVSIARAMILRPHFVVLDEPTSALDKTVQLQVMDLLRGLQAKLGLTYVFISHDLEVVRVMAHKILVMKAGQVVEQGSIDQVMDQPQHPYTQALMQAAFEKRSVNF